MKATWKPEDLLPLCVEYAEKALAKAEKLENEFMLILAEKPVRCGFLWRNKRPPTLQEVERRLKNSQHGGHDSFDFIWCDIWRLREEAKQFHALCLTCQQKPDTITLDAEELSCLRQLRKGE